MRPYLAAAGGDESCHACGAAHHLLRRTPSVLRIGTAAPVEQPVACLILNVLHKHVPRVSLTVTWSAQALRPSSCTPGNGPSSGASTTCAGSSWSRSGAMAAQMPLILRHFERGVQELCGIL